MFFLQNAALDVKKVWNKIVQDQTAGFQRAKHDITSHIIKGLVHATLHQLITNLA